MTNFGESDAMRFDPLRGTYDMPGSIRRCLLRCFLIHRDGHARDAFLCARLEDFSFALVSQ
jgi:hypothetical protein